MKQLPGIFLAVFVLLFSLAAKAATGDTLNAVVNGVKVYDAPSTAAQLIMTLDQEEGLAHMVSGLLDEGAGDLDSQAFQRRLAELSIRLSFDAGLDSASASSTASAT